MDMAQSWSESVSPQILSITPRDEVLRQESIFGALVAMATAFVVLLPRSQLFF
jgi:hypothetical protein